MIAEAVKAAYPGCSYVSVDLQTIRFSDLEKGVRYTYLTPRTAQVALVGWDVGVKPEPWRMQLRNGQVTKAGRTRIRSQRELSEKQVAQREVARAARGAALSKAQLSPSEKGNVPDRIGGSPPPVTPFARRREFGLRALVR